MKRFVVVVLVSVVAAAVLVAASALAQPSAHSAATHTVYIRGYSYLPGTAHIHRGDTVRWVWQDGNRQHNVVGSGFKIKLRAHGSVSIRFNRRGSFQYTCSIHPGMNGEVIVR